MKTKLIKKLLHLLGASIEWETQTTDEDGCWRKWSDGFSGKDDASQSIKADKVKGLRWNRHMEPSAVKWRIVRKIVFEKYFPH